MSGSQKKSFSSFLRPVPPGPTEPSESPLSLGSHVAQPAVERETIDPGVTSDPGQRARHVTATGRVRTHSATRQLPGVTFRLTEDRWERLKMLSIQTRRPIQDILGEAMDAYMKNRGLPW